MKHIKGDAVEIFKSTKDAILIHQVNCQGVMGAGIAKQIKDEFPYHFYDYIDYINMNDNVLGHWMFTECEDDKYIIGLFGQYSTSQHKRVTNYAAFAHAIFNLADREELSSIDTIIIPKYIGCGLGGGDWTIIEQILLDIEGAFGVEFTCVEFAEA